MENQPLTLSHRFSHLIYKRMSMSVFWDPCACWKKGRSIGLSMDVINEREHFCCPLLSLKHSADKTFSQISCYSEGRPELTTTWQEQFFILYSTPVTDALLLYSKFMSRDPTREGMERLKVVDPGTRGQNTPATWNLVQRSSRSLI